MIRILISTLLIFSINASNANPTKCIYIPYHSATEDEDGWQIDLPNDKSKWVDKKNVRIGKARKDRGYFLCDNVLIVPKE